MDLTRTQSIRLSGAVRQYRTESGKGVEREMTQMSRQMESGKRAEREVTEASRRLENGERAGWRENREGDWRTKK